MTIVRIDAEARWSDVVIHNNTLYYTGVPEIWMQTLLSKRQIRWRKLMRCWKNKAATSHVFLMPPCFWQTKTILPP